MACLNLDLDYLEHPKTQRLVGLLGSNAELLPIRLWAYCGKFHADAGELPGYSAQEVESVCKWRGPAGKAIDALLTVRFIHKTKDGYQVHEWNEHEGHISAFKERARDAAKKRWANVNGNATSTAKRKRKQSPNQPTKPNQPTSDGEHVDKNLSPHQVLSEYYKTRWRETYQETNTELPVFLAKEYTHAALVMAKLGGDLDKAKAVVDGYLGETSEAVRSEKHPFMWLSGRINKYASKPATRKVFVRAREDN